MRANRHTMRIRVLRRLMGALIGIVTIFALPGPAAAQNAGSGSQVAVSEGGQLRKIQDLDFGRIIPGPSGGTVTVNIDGTFAETGSVEALGDGHPAGFRLERTVFVDYPVYASPLVNNSVTIALVGNSSQTMTVTNFRTDFNRRIRFLIFTLPAYYFETEYYFKVGGTLNVGPNQAPGIYRGHFNVVLDYP